jgi:hypothetical protein
VTCFHLTAESLPLARLLPSLSLCHASLTALSSSGCVFAHDGQMHTSGLTSPGTRKNGQSRNQGSEGSGAQALCRSPAYPSVSCPDIALAGLNSRAEWAR